MFELDAVCCSARTSFARLQAEQCFFRRTCRQKKQIKLHSPPTGGEFFKGVIFINIYLDLFLTFARIGGLTFGGGMAMLPILQREVVEKKGWATDDELTDYYAIGQCTPGIIAVNTATFIGYKYKGFWGGICATLGVVFPSLIIITLLAAFLSNFADIPVVQHALAGVNSCVVALIATSVIKLGKSSLKNKASWCIFGAVLTLACLGQLVTDVSFPGAAGKLIDALLSPAPLVVCAGLAGYLLFFRKGGEDK